MRPLRLLLCAAVVSCSSSEEKPADSRIETWETESFTLQPGEEQYLCYARTLDHDLAIDRFDYKTRAGIHHAIFSRALVNEPEGFSECKVLLRTTWVPIFLSATSDASLSMPDGAGTVLPKGTQLVVQLHLLNATKAPLTNKFAVEMRKSALESPEPVGIYAFGPTTLNVPAKSETTQVDGCTITDNLQIFAAGTHMHYTGKSLKFEAGPTEAEMKEVYRLDNFNFDNQVIEPKSFSFPKGWKTRVSCTFNNPHEHDLKFGESSLDEMCFFVTFARGREGVTGCSASSPGLGGASPDCGTKPENTLGVGRKCTKGGKECASGTMCTLDQGGAPDGAPGFCFKLGCNATTDCGGGDAVCCAPKEAGGIVKVCMPSTCRPADCEL